VPIDPHEWLQQHRSSESVGTADWSGRRTTDPTDPSSAQLPSPHLEEASAPPDDADADAESIARSIALRKLATRARTRYELDQALQAKNVPSSVRDAVLDRMQQVGLLDDASYAADWVSSRQQRRHLSRRALKRELEAKGVERNDIDVALHDVDLDSELTAARNLIERKQATMSGLAHHVQYRRLAGILGRRGFETAVTVQVLNEVLGPASDERHTDTHS
jgi:regulatory protein